MERKGEGPFRASAEAPATLLEVPKRPLGPHLRPLFHRQGLAEVHLVPARSDAEPNRAVERAVFPLRSPCLNVAVGWE